MDIKHQYRDFKRNGGKDPIKLWLSKKIVTDYLARTDYDVMTKEIWSKYNTVFEMKDAMRLTAYIASQQKIWDGERIERDILKQDMTRQTAKERYLNRLINDPVAAKQAYSENVMAQDKQNDQKQLP